MILTFNTLYLLGREWCQLFINGSIFTPYLLKVLTFAGLTTNNIVKVTVFLTDMNDYAAVNTVYAKYFSSPYPARTAVAVVALPLGSRVEIEVIAQVAKPL